MQNKIKNEVKQLKEEIIQFTQELIQIKSITGQEKNIALAIAKKMKELNYDEIKCDKYGNIIGSIGNGNKKIMFDSHMDTVSVNDELEWKYGAFSGDIVDGYIYGRGSCDMKGAIASSIYAGYIMKKLNLLDGKTVYISTSVMEEDYDGKALEYILTDGGYKPDCVVICEPSELKLAIGHKGRALIKITTKGISAHGSSPEKGKNAIYTMNEILNKIKNLALRYALNEQNGSIAVSKITSKAVSLCAIPDECSIFIDRRLTINENYEFLVKELDELINGFDATWQIYDEIGKSYTNEDVVLHSFLPAWEISLDNEFVKKAINSYKKLYAKNLEIFKWNFSTNGVSSAGKLKIPTIGFGPGSAKFAHAKDERCPISDILQAFEFYSMFVYEN